MDPRLVLLIGAGILKLFSVGWLASIATSPVALASRRRFLEANKAGLENMVKLGVAPAPVRVEELMKDFELLESTIEKGWDDPQVFAAAYRISVWKFYEHAYGAVSGIGRLGTNTATLATENINGWVDSIFPPPKPESDTE